MKKPWMIVFGIAGITMGSVAISAHAATSFLRLPYVKGQSFVVVQGYNTLPTHIKKDGYALDLSQNGCDAYGKTVVAAAAGIATTVDEEGYNGGYGTEVIINDGNDLISRYAHMIPGSVGVAPNGAVRPGQAIGAVGDTGLVAGLACPTHPGTHLHFAMDIRNGDGSLTATKPEPISGYTNITAGKWYVSDNDIEAPLIPSIFTNTGGKVLGAYIAMASSSSPASSSSSATLVNVTTVPLAINSPPLSRPPTGGVSAAPAQAPAPTAQPPVDPTPPPVQTDTPPASSTAPIDSSSTNSIDVQSSSPILFQQLDDSHGSMQSWYDDNWYDLGSGFSGTLNSLTLEGKISSASFYASHVWLEAFKDPNYTAMVQQYAISDGAPFTADIATTTLSGFSIVLKPYFYYRLSTIQDYQNRSVVLSGTSATGTMMWNLFVYGTGRVEYTGTFMPYMIMEGIAATSTLTPPPLTTPTDLATSFDPETLQLNLSWATSTDPDWAGNPLHYEVNYSMSDTLDDSGWGATLPIQLAPGNSYLLGVRAADDFGDVSAVATTTWSFPPGFVAYTLSPGFNYANQEFVLSTTTVLSSIEIFTANFQTGARNAEAVGCSLALFYNDATSSYRMIAADNGYSGYGCAGHLTYSFASSSPELVAGNPYQWIFQSPTGNPSTQASVQFYGTASDTAGGPFSDPSLANARFVINGPDGPVFAN